MRTIDPFVAPGLWGGASKPSQPLAAERASPPKRFAAGNAPIIPNAPLACLAGSVLGPRFHAWYGRSGKRTICSIYPVLGTDETKGLPDFTEGIVIAARRDHGRLCALSVFAIGETETPDRCVDTAIAAGASEWHIHLPAGDEQARRELLRDLGA